MKLEERRHVPNAPARGRRRTGTIEVDGGASGACDAPTAYGGGGASTPFTRTSMVVPSALAIAAQADMVPGLRLRSISER